jgi:hypothetical protein
VPPRRLPPAEPSRPVQHPPASDGPPGEAGPQGPPGDPATSGGLILERENYPLTSGTASFNLDCDWVVANAIVGSVSLDPMEPATLTGSYQDPIDPRNWVFTFSGPLAHNATAHITCAREPEED